MIWNFDSDMIVIGEDENWRISFSEIWYHIVPEKGLKRGQWVEQGNEIGKVFHGEDDVLPHLDFGIRYQNDYRKYLDPIEIFESEDLRKLTANPQGALIFSIDQLPGATIRYNFPGWSKSWE